MPDVTPPTDLDTTNSASIPPSFVLVPAPVAYADVSEELAMTMIRIVGLCWRHDYKHTPALTGGELSRLVGRPKSTLYRHLEQLEIELGWLRIERSGGHLELWPQVQAPEPGLSPQATVDQRRQALAKAGIEGLSRDELAADHRLDPDWIRAWHLWTQHPARQSLNNPPGYIVLKLRRHEPPPGDFLRLVTLTAGEEFQLRQAQWTGGADLDDELYDLLPLYREVLGGPDRRARARP